MKAGAPYTSTCVSIDAVGNVNYVGGDFCIETGLSVKVTTTGGEGATVETM